MSDESFTGVADDLWRGTGHEQTFPRPIEQAVAMRLPLTVVKVPSVGVGQVRRWLGERDLDAPLPDDDGRALMGCLVAYRGCGFAFVCGEDPPDEQRLTIAHEAAHFILDYDRPRRRVLAMLGPAAAEVLDGVRPATVAERAAALLAHVRLGPHVHLLPRAGEAADADLPVAFAESRADALALELVAPRERIVERLQSYVPADDPARLDQAAVARQLGRDFGVPPHVFRPILRAAAAPNRRAPVLAAAIAAFRQRRDREKESI